MTPFVRLLQTLVGTPRIRHKTSRGPSWRPTLELLEDRRVLSTVSTITSNFNGTAIPADDYLWFSSVAKVQGVGSSPVTLNITNQKITFTANGTPYNLSVPDTVLTLTPGATSAATVFNSGSGAWNTNVPAQFSGNVFLGGLTFRATAGLPGGVNPVSWQASFSSDTAGIKVNWQWAAAVYSQFSSDPGTLGVKPVDDNHLSAYQNSDHAGTPENFKAFVLGGARGGGGSNFTGSYSATNSVVPSVGAPPSSLSGFVYEDDNNNGIKEGSEIGIAGVVITLTGTDTQGHSVYLTAVTDVNGFYSFTGLVAGTYALSKGTPAGFTDGLSSVGTIGGNPNGNAQTDLINQIVLGAGQNGIQYNFAELLAGS
jgi:hypothetical protein